METNFRSGVACTDASGAHMGSEPLSTLLIREADGELIILDARADRVHQLNSSASLVWELFHRGRSRDEIAEELCLRFDVTTAQAQADVDTVIRSFRERRLVR